VLSSENKLEIFKVLGSHKHEALLKKLVKNEKKASVKRTHSEAMDSQDDSLPVKKTVDKAKLMKMIEEGTYDITNHFSRKLEIPLTELTNAKAKSFAVLKSDEKSLRVVNDPFSQKTEYGQLKSHRTPIRGVSISAND
jgi:hypothetical protein